MRWGRLVPEYLPDPACPHCQLSEQLLPRATLTGSPVALEPSGRAVVTERSCVCVQGQHIFSARPYSRYFWLLRPPGLCCNCLAHPQATSGSCANKSLFTEPGEGDRFVPFLLPRVLLLPLASSPGAECGLKPCAMAPRPSLCSPDRSHPSVPCQRTVPPLLGAHRALPPAPTCVVSFAVPSLPR